jgi:hypothetical protein
MLLSATDPKAGESVTRQGTRCRTRDETSSSLTVTLDQPGVIALCGAILSALRKTALSHVQHARGPSKRAFQGDAMNEALVSNFVNDER